MNLEEFRRVQAELAAVVQDALAYGPDPALNERFRVGRARLQSNYGLVRNSFARVWTTSADPKRFPAQNTDPFESLLASPTLEGLLKRDDRQIRRDLEKGKSADFENTALWQKTFALADQLERTPLPHARLPSIRLDSPKITRQLTTEWFAKRVQQRYLRCMARAG